MTEAQQDNQPQVSGFCSRLFYGPVVQFGRDTKLKILQVSVRIRSGLLFD